MRDARRARRIDAQQWSDSPSKQHFAHVVVCRTVIGDCGTRQSEEEKARAIENRDLVKEAEKIEEENKNLEEKLERQD